MSVTLESVRHSNIAGYSMNPISDPYCPLMGLAYPFCPMTSEVCHNEIIAEQFY